MAKLPKGINGPIIGKIGNKVAYMLNDDNIIRTIGDPGPKNDLQKGVNNIMGLISPLLVNVQNYVELGFKNTKKEKKMSSYSYALKVNLKNGVKGIYPKQKIDYKNLSFSEGDIAVPKKPKVTLNGDTLEFTWNADLENIAADSSDQVMLVAYFPQEKKAITLISGERRTTEFQQLKLTSFTKKMKIETYMSFVNVDRSDVSNSVHVGCIIWDQIV